MKEAMIEYIRADYPPGSHVKLIKMKSEPQMPSGLKGTVTHVDDIGQIHVNWDNGSTLALTEEDSFCEINVIKVVVCGPDEIAEIIEIEDLLEAMKAVVGGPIEEYMPFHSDGDPRYAFISGDREGGPFYISQNLLKHVGQKMNDLVG